MRLPSKVTNYRSSLLALFPYILTELSLNDLDVLELYHAVKKGRYSNLSIGVYLQALDCLFALGKINFIGDGEVLQYVD
jgi:hypothetical protein